MQDLTQKTFHIGSGINFLDDHNLLRRHISEQSSLEAERLRFIDMHFNDSPQMYMAGGTMGPGPGPASPAPIQGPPPYGYASNGLSSSSASEGAKGADGECLQSSITTHCIVFSNKEDSAQWCSRAVYSSCKSCLGDVGLSSLYEAL